MRISDVYIYIYTGWWFQPSEKKSEWEGWHTIYEMENKIHVPNHQPVYIIYSYS